MPDDLPLARLVDEVIAELQLYGQEAGRRGRRLWLRGRQRQLPTSCTIALALLGLRFSHRLRLSV